MSEENEIPDTDAPQRKGGRPRQYRPEPEMADPALRLSKTRHEAARFERDDTREDDDREDPRAPEQGRLYRKRTRNDDRFYIDKRLIPAQTSYEWKRETVFKGMSNASKDVAYDNDLRDNHWKPVPASRHPNLVGDASNESVIRRDGMILMERPKYLTDEARQEDYENAVGQVRGQQANIAQPKSSAEAPRVGAKIRTSYESIPIAD